MDYKDPKTGDVYPTEEIANMLILLFISNFESTEVCLSNSVLDLAAHPEHWKRAKEEVDKALANKDIRSVLDSKFVHGCVMETARLSQLVFGLGRTPGKW